MIDELKTLQTSAWRTSGARYNAARRLRRREIFATVSLALMSALTVAMAFLQKVYAPPTSHADNYLSTVSAALGIFLLTVSLVEWGTKTGAVAEELHRNAERLNAFWRRLAMHIAASNNGSQLNVAQAIEFQADYDGIKAECTHNHLPIDDLFFRAQHSGAKEFASLGRLACYVGWVKWQMASVWYITGIWLLLIGLLTPLFNENMWKASSEVPVASVGSPSAATDKVESK